jgi:hypothetical protein
MLGWKYLSLVGLLIFLNIFEVKADDDTSITTLPPCSVPGSDEGSNEGSLEEDLLCLEGSVLYNVGSTEPVEGLIENEYIVINCLFDEECTRVMNYNEIDRDDDLLIYQYGNGKVTKKKSFTYLDTNEKKLITCNSEGACLLETNEGYYVNDVSKSSVIDSPLINIDNGDATTVYNVQAGNTYAGADYNVIECKTVSSMVKCTSRLGRLGEIFVNSAGTGLEDALIECSEELPEDGGSDSGNGSNEDLPDKEVYCYPKEATPKEYYLNSGLNRTTKPLIECNDSKCEEKVGESGANYLNAASDSLTDAIIFCSNNKCEKQTPAGVNKYYVGKDGDDVDGLIECLAGEGSEEGQCSLKSAFTSEGYYLNSGYNKSVNQTIICDSTEGCNALKVDLGYYVNAGNTEKPIIKCEKEGNECVEEASSACPEISKAVPGNYCYESGQLKFFTVNNSTAITATRSDNIYAYAIIPSYGFPGIKTETGSLFKISRFFITRYYKSGIIMLDKNGKLVDSLDGDTSDITLFDCNETTKKCNEREGCTSNTYMFDSENAKVVFCNDGKLEYAKFTGYVVDANRFGSGTKHPYIIQCKGGENCISIKPKVSTYYENNGYDSNINGLIQCNSNNCMTVAAKVGYYVAHGENENAGIIKCTSNTSCSYIQVKNKVKYVNAGYDKKNNAIIDCYRGKCSVAKAKSGYYLTHTSTLLIQCTSPTSCAEFTPTVNYYDNADSSESSNTIINCVQNSNVVTCSSEATNNGFYLSSISNVLIRCKNGQKCKTIVVKNGIFRGAFKGLTSNKRSENVKNVHERTDDDLEEDGKMVNLRDNNDDAYGIIRCVAGKCAALSASELAAIPMCEFNNNFYCCW